MADFLTRLAGRTLGVVPTVQPMIAPLYAPGSALLAGQAGLPVFEEEISSGAPGQTSPAGHERLDFPLREPLQEQALTAGQESGASIFSSPMPFSSPQYTTLPQVGDKHARLAQPAAPALSRESVVNSQNTLSSIFVTSEDGQQSVAQDIPLSSPTTPLPAPDKTNPSGMREGQALSSQAAQRQLESASFITQEQWEGDAPHTVINVNSVERQLAAGNLHQSAMSEGSHSRASIRWAADALANRHELLPEGTAPAAPPAPTIQVTIGRIEVRATQPPPVQRQVPRPGSRMMSLEEYLNQQAKGGQ
jgi:hypothetical protein